MIRKKQSPLSAIKDILRQSRKKKRDTTALTLTPRSALKGPEPPGKPQRTQVKERGEFVWLYGDWIPLHELRGAFSSGTPESGKTLQMMVTFASVVDHIRPGSGRRLIVCDLKGDFTATLKGKGVKFTILDLSAAGYSWDVAKDFWSSTSILQFLHSIIPETKGENSFFVNASRSIAYGLWVSLRHRFGEAFTFGDLYNACTADIEAQIEILLGHPRGRELVSIFFESAAKKTVDNVRMELLTQIRRYAKVAAHVQRPGARLFSLDQFMKGEGILVIRQDLSAPQAMKPLIQAFLARLVQLIQARPGFEYPPTDFFFADELETLEFVELDALRLAAIFCRSKGLVLNLASQTISGLHRNGNKENTDAILGCLPNKSFFHNDDPETARRAAQEFGRHRVIEESYSESYGGENVSFNVSHQPREVDVLQSGDITNLPWPDKTVGIYGHYRSRHAGNELWKFIPASEIERLKPLSIPVPYIRITGIFEPKPWSEEEHCHFVSGKALDGATTEDIAEASPLVGFFEQAIREEIFDLADDVLRRVILERLYSI